MSVDTLPKYSVLMSLYVKEKPEYLRRAIDSMINQTVKPDEIVIVEDGPLNDELYSIVEEYKKTYPNLFTITVNQKNLGLGLALNEGLKVCRNELVARMDTDDISKPERCGKQLNVFNNDCDLCIVGTWVDEFNGSVENVTSVRKVPCEQKDIYAFAKRRSAFNHPTVMYKKTAVLSFGGYSDLRRNQDVDLFGRMLYGKCKAANIPESLLWFRSNDDLAKRRRSWENTKTYIKTIGRLKKLGYSGLSDYVIVSLGQIVMFICPVKLQHWIYRKFLRG